MALNRCEFIGHLGKKAEVKTLEGGTKVASFSIAVTERGYTSKNGTEVPEKTTWVSIVAWRGLAEIVDRYTDKGSHVYVAGKFQSRSYEKDGVTRYMTEILAENIELLSRKPQEGQAQEASAPTQAQPSEWSGSLAPEADDDLPF
jgi:single-strand DNA-binding protein